ncbi:MAG: hypothetical protein CSA09_04035 [Candidatus Contendobacter odensis]|uniref:Acriflavin resistance protein n=1 Tax=Candidatus Contendibacter odensensis TaxID=1400860 RepID=A0A2G6PEJ9_9GAMM|nr:MAG: hypothetical protein CSA09_04035 [Candidatus Contendobacter odensis]
MEVLTRFGIDKSRFTIFMMLVVILMGVSVYFNLSKREDPAITIRTVMVSAMYPGMSPERVEDLIVDPIERKAREISEVEDIRSLVSTGNAMVSLELSESIPTAQLTQVKQTIRNKMSEVTGELPEGTSGPYVNTDYGDVVIASIAVTGDGYSYAELKASATALRKKLYTVKGIGKVLLFGEQKERIWLDIDSRKLATVGVQLSQLINDLRAQNIILPSGNIDVSGTTLNLEVNGDFANVTDIENLLTHVQDSNTLIPLRDLLTVRRGYEEPHKTPIYFNGKPAIVLGVQMSDGQDIQVLGKNLQAAVAEFEPTQPLGISYDYSTYQETDVTKSINDALSNVIQTIAVVLLVLVIFLGIRPALIVACIVPFTVMFALIAMGYMNIELHVVSIAAVIIALGLLVDNGLVIVEDIQGQMNNGVDTRTAALNASKQFGVPLAVASITTVAAFLPLLLMEGTSGEYAFSLGAVVGLMLLGSWGTALYFLPALCVWFAKPKTKKSGEKPSLLVRMYGVIVRKALSIPVLVTLISFGLTAAGLSQFANVKQEMFPISARAQFLIYMDLPKGTSISKTEEVALEIEKWLSDKTINPEIKNTTTYVGDGGPRFYLALSPADQTPSSAFVLVNTNDFEGALAASNRARQHLYKNHPEARFKVKHLSMGGAESGIIELKISGPDANQLLAIAAQLEAKFAEIPNIIQNENDWGNKVLKSVVNIAQDKAREHGVTSQDLSKALDAYISGATVSTFREGEKAIPIVLRGVKSSRDSLEDLAGLTIPVNGKLVSLNQVAELIPTYDVSQMRRENQQRTITVSAKSTDLSAYEMLSFIQPTLDNLDWSSGYSYAIGGEIKNSKESNEMLASGMGVALVVMLTALIFQFNSARRVVLIFMTIPLVMIGSPLALLLTGQPLSFFATLGLISLAGIIINNAIVLIDQIDLEMQHLTLLEAIISAAEKRVTPIMLTTLTTVMGLIPMAISGGALFEPMAILMIGGISLASVISLFFVPSVFLLFFRFEHKQMEKAVPSAGDIS